MAWAWMTNGVLIMSEISSANTRTGSSLVDLLFTCPRRPRVPCRLCHDRVQTRCRDDGEDGAKCSRTPRPGRSDALLCSANAAGGSRARRDLPVTSSGAEHCSAGAGEAAEWVTTVSRQSLSRRSLGRHPQWASRHDAQHPPRTAARRATRPRGWRAVRRWRTETRDLTDIDEPHHACVEQQRGDTQLRRPARPGQSERRRVAGRVAEWDARHRAQHRRPRTLASPRARSHRARERSRYRAVGRSPRLRHGSFR